MKRNFQKSAENRKIIIRGFYLPTPLYRLCITELKSERYFQQNLESLSDYGDTLKHYEELVENKVSLEERQKIIDEAFGKIPTQYHAAMRYMISTSDTGEKQKEKLQEKYDVEIKEAKAWLRKLVYFYAEAAGYPVPHSGREYELYIDNSGECEICPYE